MQSKFTICGRGAFDLERVDVCHLGLSGGIKAGEKPMETVECRPRKLKFQQREKNPSRGRVSGNRCKCIKQVHESCELKGAFRITFAGLF